MTDTNPGGAPTAYPERLRVLITGTPLDGFYFTGPFPDGNTAVEHGESQDGDWWIAMLDEPESPGLGAYAEMRDALTDVQAARDGYSNDEEIRTLRAALDLALARWPGVELD